MDIAQLKTFLEIYHIRNFGKAADKLCITPAAASARMKLLEERLGIKLFIRRHSAIEPTPAGVRFYKYAILMTSAWEQARQAVGLPDTASESISIGFIADIWRLFLNEKIVTIQNQKPELALNLRIHTSPVIHEQLLAGSLDLGFVFEPLQVPALEFVSVGAVELRLFSSKKKTTLDQALGEGYVLVDWGASFLFEHAKHFSDKPSPELKTNYGLMALDLIRQGGGAAYLPKNISQPLDLKLYKVKGAPPFFRTLYAVFRRDLANHDTILELVELID